LDTAWLEWYSRQVLCAAAGIPWKHAPGEGNPRLSGLLSEVRGLPDMTADLPASITLLLTKALLLPKIGYGSM
jgi:hypothetical protein